MEELASHNHHVLKPRLSPQKISPGGSNQAVKNHVGTVVLYGVPIVSLVIESQERLCLAQISNTLLKQFSYNEIHNRRVALGITCVQCTPVQLEILRRAGAMPVSSRRCGMITRREAERLCKSFLGDNAPPRLPDDFAFSVHHECAWGCRGAFLPARYNSSRAKCIKCTFCGLFFSPNKFIFHSHRTTPSATYIQPDAANFNSWRRHMKLSGSPPDNIVYAWEDVKAMFNGGTRKRMLSGHQSQSRAGTNAANSARSSPSAPPSKQLKMESPPPTPTPYPQPGTTPAPAPLPHRVPPFPDLPIPITMMDYVWHGMDGLKPSFLSPYLPWLGSTKRSVLSYGPLLTSPNSEALTHFHSHGKYFHQSAFRPVYPAVCDAPVRPKKIMAADSKDGSPSRISPDESQQRFQKQTGDISKSSDSSDSNDSIKDDSSNRTRLSESLLMNRPDLLRTLTSMKHESVRVPKLSLDKKNEDVAVVEDLDVDEDETVDIETTDDVSDQPRDMNLRARDTECDSTKRSQETTGAATPRIWTVARFSLDEPSRSPENIPLHYNSNECNGMNLTTTGASSQNHNKNVCSPFGSPA